MDTITDFHFLFVPWFMLSMFCLLCKLHTADVKYRRLYIWTHVFSHASSTGRKKDWPEDVHCGIAIILSVRRSLHRARWFLTRRCSDLMNWLFNVKQFTGIRFSTSAARMSKAGWWDIVANAALFSDLCWHDAGLGFHHEVPPKSCAVTGTPAAGLIAVSKQGRRWTASSELQWCQCFFCRPACWGRRHVFPTFAVFGSVQVSQKPRQSSYAPPPLPVRKGCGKW